MEKEDWGVSDDDILVCAECHVAGIPDPLAHSSRCGTVIRCRRKPLSLEEVQGWVRDAGGGGDLPDHLEKCLRYPEMDVYGSRAGMDDGGPPHRIVTGKIEN